MVKTSDSSGRIISTGGGAADFLNAPQQAAIAFDSGIRISSRSSGKTPQL